MELKYEKSCRLNCILPSKCTLDSPLTIRIFAKPTYLSLHYFPSYINTKTYNLAISQLQEVIGKIGRMISSTFTNKRQENAMFRGEVSLRNSEVLWLTIVK